MSDILVSTHACGGEITPAPAALPEDQAARRQKAILIAKDVLKLTKSRKVLVRKGVYLKIAGSFGTVGRKLSGFLRKKKTKPCEVCAQGAMLLSCIRLGLGDLRVPTGCSIYDPEDNGIGVSELNSKYLKQSLREVFSNQQLAAIEAAFEMSTIDYSNGYDTRGEDIDKAARFGAQYVGDSTARVRAIMTNIIDNGGEFRP